MTCCDHDCLMCCDVFLVLDLSVLDVLLNRFASLTAEDEHKAVHQTDDKEWQRDVVGSSLPLVRRSQASLNPSF